MRIWVPVFLAATALQAQAEDQSIWCGQEIMMFATAGGDLIQFNEHTLCELDRPWLPVAEETWTSAVACTNVYVLDFNEDGTIETHEMPVDGFARLSLTPQSDGTLLMETDHRDASSVTLRRCD